LKITFMLPGYARKPSGGYRVVYEYANHLAARGHDIIIVHPEYFPKFRHIALYKRIHRNLRNFFFTNKIRWIAIDPRIRMLYIPDASPRHIPDADAIFATAWQTAEAVLEYPASKGDKYYLLQSYESWNGPQERVDATWRAPMHKVVIAEWLREKGLELGVPPDSMTLIPNAIDHDCFKIIEPLEQRPTRVSMMFSRHEVKGVADGIRALELARQACPDMQALLFGICDRPDSLPAWIGYVKNPPQSVLAGEIYNKSKMYLYSSWLEGFYLPAAEAMACGCAIVGTNIDGVRAFAEHEKTALLSPIKEPEGLAANLLAMLNDDELRMRIARAGRKRILEFTWAHSSDLLERMIMKKKC
jgi:L-malate glycosyltransferase